jgi:hypothetical protein
MRSNVVVSTGLPGHLCLTAKPVMGKSLLGFSSDE